MAVHIEMLDPIYWRMPNYWPMHAPVFAGGKRTPDDIEEARALYLALDPWSQFWYRDLAESLGMPAPARPPMEHNE